METTRLFIKQLTNLLDQFRDCQSTRPSIRMALLERRFTSNTALKEEKIAIQPHSRSRLLSMCDKLRDIL